jgi:mono/diheme cytochrome c family protein
MASPAASKQKRSLHLASLKYVALAAACVLFAGGIPQPSAQAAPAAASPVSAGRVDFDRDIRPILADKCFACHGPDAVNNRSPLRFDSEAHAMADLGDGRHAIVRSHPEQSELVRRVTADDTAIRMPPVYAGRTLTEAEIQRLTDWIAQGAPWQQHWAFVQPVRPPTPAVDNAGWVRNAIDSFVLAKLEREGLQPSAEAARATLIRRVSLDLTGLPPTPKEIDDFLNDAAPDAYEKVVDRLLASPRYGERMAFHWLDAARYADTNGYQIDGEREMWRWRDWVIDGFNRNMPFDQFAVEQLAGDLLPNPTSEQRIATAFNRNHRGNSEDGLVPAEYAVEYVIDRVDTVSTVFLGLTLGCARCHNHKFDPFTQKEFYQLYAYFNSIPEDGRFSNFGNSAPWMPAPTREQQQQLQQLEKEIAATQGRLNTALKQTETEQRHWEQSLAGSPPRQWFPTDDLLLQQPFDQGSNLVVGERNRGPQEGAEPAAEQKAEGDKELKKEEAESAPAGFQNGEPQYAPSPLGQAVRFDGNLVFDAGNVASFDYRDRLHDFKDRFAISAWFYPESESSGAIVTRMNDNGTEQENGLPKEHGYGLFFVNGKVHFNLVGVWADDSFRVETEDALPARQWHHVVATFDSLQPSEKVQLYVDGEKQKLKINNGRLFRQFSVPKAHLLIGGGGGPQWRFKGMLDEVRIYDTLPTAEQIAVLACADPLSSIAAIPPQTRSEGQRRKMRNAFLDEAAPVAAQREWQKWRALQQQKFRLETALPTVMVMQELPEPRPAFVLKRGSYDAPQEQVERGVPAVLPPLPKGSPNNRLGLARWIVSEKNPLTSRVTVNRLWQMLFGAGLVKTVDDFGAQGEQPSHPELLDWLAVEFQQKGWNVKQILKTMVMSATYRQSSKETPESLQRDLDNRLLGRGPRLRLSAEMIRDQALFVSGLLVEKLGGPSVKPYQPAGLYTDMVFSNMTDYGQAKGEGLWRRSLYTFWKRTVMPPAMQVFDASSREYCTVRETRTNTPLQALNLMNDETYVESARMLAQRMLHEGGASPEDRLALGFRLAAGRAPEQSERQVLLGSLQAQREYFQSHPDAAAALLAVGEKRNDPKLQAQELAAYAVVGSLILNLDEVITKQ